MVPSSRMAHSTPLLTVQTAHACANTSSPSHSIASCRRRLKSSRRRRDEDRKSEKGSHYVAARSIPAATGACCPQPAPFAASISDDLRPATLVLSPGPRLHALHYYSFSRRHCDSTIPAPGGPRSRAHPRGTLVVAFFTLAHCKSIDSKSYTLQTRRVQSTRGRMVARRDRLSSRFRSSPA